MTSEFEKDRACLPLPEHWEMRVDTRTGMPYYLNHLKQFTTWDDPRAVTNPRCMLNDVGSMMRQRSTSPAPQSHWRRPSEDGSTSIPFNHFFTPAEHTHSLPQPPRSNGARRLERPGLANDSWFGSGFDEPDDAFFKDVSWPIKAHSLRMRSHSPFDTDSASDSTRGSSLRLGGRRQPSKSTSLSTPPNQASVNIPIKSEPCESCGPDEKERVIIPTQYKQHATNTKEPAVEQEIQISESPRPKLVSRLYNLIQYNNK